MSHRHSHYRPPTIERVKKLDDWKIQRALRVLFGHKDLVTRQSLLWWGVDQFTVNSLTDRQVRKYDVRPLAEEILHCAISGLVSEVTKEGVPKLP